jgi:hypothetical protein
MELGGCPQIMGLLEYFHNFRWKITISMKFGKNHHQ